MSTRNSNHWNQTWKTEVDRPRSSKGLLNEELERFKHGLPQSPGWSRSDVRCRGTWQHVQDQALMFASFRAQYLSSHDRHGGELFPERGDGVPSA